MLAIFYPEISYDRVDHLYLWLAVFSEYFPLTSFVVGSRCRNNPRPRENLIEVPVGAVERPSVAKYWSLCCSLLNTCDPANGRLSSEQAIHPHPRLNWRNLKQVGRPPRIALSLLGHPLNCRQTETLWWRGRMVERSDSTWGITASKVMNESPSVLKNVLVKSK